MSTKAFKTSLIVALSMAGMACGLNGGQTNEVPAKPNGAELRQELKNLSPEQRRAKIQELRQRYGPLKGEALTNRVDGLRNLTPEERRARFEELRQKRSLNPAGKGRQGLDPAERQARIKAKLEELRQKKDKGTLTPAEDKQLERIEQFNKRLDQQGGAATPADKSSSEKASEPKPKAE